MRRSRALVTIAALAGAVLVLLPLGGGASAATSNGANGDIAFARSGDLYLASSGGVRVHRRCDRSVVVARRDEARVLARGRDRDLRRQRLHPDRRSAGATGHGAGVVA